MCVRFSCVVDMCLMPWLCVTKLPLVGRFLSTQVSICGDTLLPCRGDSEGPHSARSCWNCRSFLARRLVMQPLTSGVAGHSVQVPVGAWDETYIIDSWWRRCWPCWVEGIKHVVVVLYKVAVLQLWLLLSTNDTYTDAFWWWQMYILTFFRYIGLHCICPVNQHQIYF